MCQEEIQEAVCASSLLRDSGLSADCMKVRKCHKGQIISDRQKGQEILGLVVSGRVDVYSIALDGREILLSQLKRGDCFGIINLFRDKELPTVLRCRSDTTLLMIPKSKLIEAMEANGSLAIRYAGVCNRKMQFLIRRIEFLTMQSGRKKLIQYLLMQPECHGEVCLEESREELASVLGISRASLFRELALLQNRELISQEHGRIRILDRKELEDILYCCS